jgi:hypothetical protein
VPASTDPRVGTRTIAAAEVATAVARRTSVVVGMVFHGTLPTAPYAQTSDGVTRGASGSVGRQSEMTQTPGGTRSRPLKNWGDLGCRSETGAVGPVGTGVRGFEDRELLGRHEVGGGVRQHQVAARRNRLDQPVHQAVRVVFVEDEVQDRDQQHRHRPGEVERFPGSRSMMRSGSRWRSPST